MTAKIIKYTIHISSLTCYKIETPDLLLKENTIILQLISNPLPDCMT